MPSALLFFHKGLTADAVDWFMEPGHIPYFLPDGTARGQSFYWCMTDGRLDLTYGLKKVTVTDMEATCFDLYKMGPYIWNFTTTRLYNIYVGGSPPHGVTEYGNFLAAPYARQFKTARYKKFCIHKRNYNNLYSHLMVDGDGNAFFAAVDNPSGAPSGSAGAAGSPNGVYKLYYSFLITYPNGMVYETGLSPASGDVTVTNQQINWTGIGTCPSQRWSSTYGIDPTIHRKLYRGPGTGGTLADIYYVATIANNSSTTYTDNNSDATLIANGVCRVKDFIPMHGAKGTNYAHIFEFHNGRLYEADAQYPWRMNYSEPAYGDTAAANENILPIARKATNWNDIRPAGLPGENRITALVSWGSTLYIGTQSGWIKKSGESPSTWVLRKTNAIHGPISQNGIAISSSPFGIIYFTKGPMGEIRLALFDGDSSRIIGSPKYDKIFDYLLKGNDELYLSLRISGNLLYIERTGLVIDLSRWPDLRMWNTQLHSMCRILVPEQNYGAPADIDYAYVCNGQSLFKKQYAFCDGTEDRWVYAGQIHYPFSTPLFFGDLQSINKVKVLKELIVRMDLPKNSTAPRFVTYGGIQVSLDNEGTWMQWGQDGTRYYPITSDGITVIKFPPGTKCRTMRLYVAFGPNSLSNEYITVPPRIYFPWEIKYDVLED